MTDSTPLDRVRKAIRPLVQTSWSKRADEAVDEIARAALDELPPRIPTPKMIAAAKATVSGFPRDSAIVAIWQAMFEAALTQEPEQ